MTKISLRILVCAVFVVASGAAFAASYEVVLRGGEVIALKEPWVVKGSNAILLRSDGTLLSVPLSEIDQKATAARAAAPRAPAPAPVTPPPSSPAEVVRANQDRPHARVRITDADVGHEPVSEEAESPEKAAASTSVTGAKLEVADYTQNKSGNQFAVRGSIRNVGATTASSIRLSVSLLDEKGEIIGKRDAGVENTALEAGHTSPFSAVFDVGNKNVASLRFQPLWIGAPPPAPAGTANAGSSATPAGQTPASASPSAAATNAPRPVPTPYGRGLYYAPGPPPAASTAPADGGGYIPGAARPEDQPKPPDPDLR